MIVSFTQTYSNYRKDLISDQMNDKNLVQLKNCCDLNVYSFHNCRDEVIKHFEKVNRLERVKIFRFNGVTYGECIREIMQYFEDIGARYLFFCQDDTLSVSPFNYKYLLNQLKPNIFIALGFRTRDFGVKSSEFLTALSNQDFINSGFWALNDSPYLADINVVREMYDNEYLNKISPMLCELHLAKKYKAKPIIKHVLKKRAFNNINTKGVCSIGRQFKGIINGKFAQRYRKLLTNINDYEN